MASLHGSGWFACPNSVFDQCETAYEIVVVTYLLRRAGPDGACWPSLTTIARDTKLSEATVKRTLSALESRAVVVRTRRPKAGERHESTVYEVHHRAPVGLPQNPSGAPTEPRTRPNELDPSEGKETPSLSPLTTELTKLFGKHLPRRFFETVGSLRSRFGEDVVLAALRRHVTTVSAADNPLMYLNRVLEREVDASRTAPPKIENRRYTPEEEFEHRFGGLPDGHPARVAAEIRLGRCRAGGVDPDAVSVPVPPVPRQGGGAVPETGRSGSPPVCEAVSALSEGR